MQFAFYCDLLSLFTHKFKTVWILPRHKGSPCFYLPHWATRWHNCWIKRTDLLSACLCVQYACVRVYMSMLCQSLMNVSCVSKRHWRLNVWKCKHFGGESTHEWLAIAILHVYVKYKIIWFCSSEFILLNLQGHPVASSLPISACSLLSPVLEKP